MSIPIDYRKSIDQIIESTNLDPADRVFMFSRVFRELIEKEDIADEDITDFFSGKLDKILQPYFEGLEFTKYMPQALRLCYGMAECKDVSSWKFEIGRDEKNPQDIKKNKNLHVLKSRVNGGDFEWGMGQEYQNGDFINRLHESRIIKKEDKDYVLMKRMLGEQDLGDVLVYPIQKKDMSKPTGRFLTFSGKKRGFSEIEKKLLDELVSKIQSNMMPLETHRIDELTGLYDKAQRDSVIRNETLKAKKGNYSVGLVAFDIDYFKKFNDTYGHLEGDYLLQQIGELISQVVRRSDKSLRAGGEEFLIVAPKTNEKSLLHLGEKIRRSIDKHKFLSKHGPRYEITVSVGALLINGFPKEGKHMEHAIKEIYRDTVDAFLYKAKEAGRNCVCGYDGVFSRGKSPDKK